ERHQECPSKWRYDWLGERAGHSGGRIGHLRAREVARDAAERHVVENCQRQIDVAAERSTDDGQIGHVDRTVAWRVDDDIEGATHGTHTRDGRHAVRPGGDDGAALHTGARYLEC